MQIRTLFDDGKGRVSLEISEPPVVMHRKEHYSDISEKGDYAFDTWADTFDFLVMGCPFCGFGAPMPWLIKIITKEPLDILQELHCGKCHAGFVVIQGVAHRSWLPTEEFECLTKKLSEAEKEEV